MYTRLTLIFKGFTRLGQMESVFEGASPNPGDKFLRILLILNISYPK
jgi:hypothetical protein